MRSTSASTAVCLIGSTVFAATLCFAASLPKPTGAILGVVSSRSGVPQMGATVTLYDRFDHLVGHALTTEKGAFAFASLSPDIYGIRVSLASFLPAVKHNVLVQPGMQSLLNVNLASVFSSIELVSTRPAQMMSDDWKWVLRSSASTRPVLRLLPDLDAPKPRESASIFSGTRGLVRFSAGDQGLASWMGNEPDMGTAFAVATSMYGHNQLQVSGNFGYSANSGAPTAAFRTSYRRELAGGLSPEVRLTMRQLFLPGRLGSALYGGQPDNLPELRTVSAAFLDQSQLTESLRVEYGMSLESITFIDRLNYFSPYARFTFDRGRNDMAQFAFTSGTPAPELLNGAGGEAAETQQQQDLSGLALFPRISLRSGVPRVQRSSSYEVGYRHTWGSRTFSFGGYTEHVHNAALTMLGAPGMTAAADMLPDLFSDSWVLNAGDYNGTGLLASVTQNLGEHMDASIAYGTGTTLVAGNSNVGSGDLEAILQRGRRHSVTARLAGTIPHSGTQLSSSYQWTDQDALTPNHIYLTQRLQEGLGLNVRVRQPLPAFGNLPGRLELSAELRNLLAQGYVPLTFNGRRVYLMPTPRTLRGSLSFVF